MLLGIVINLFAIFSMLFSLLFVLFIRSKENLNDGTGRRSNTGPQIGALLGNGTGDSRTLHFTLGLEIKQKTH